MKKFAVVMMIAGMATAAVAKADGFTCQGRSTGVNIKLFNHTDADAGTRSAAVLVLSNPAIQSPNKTIAKFTDANQTLAYKGYGKYEAKVDLRFNDSGRAGENIAQSNGLGCLFRSLALGIVGLLDGHNEVDGDDAFRP